MRIGERRRPVPQRQRGFTYVLLLFSVALAGAGLSALGPQWLTQAQRQREAELLFRGLAYREALARYAQASPAGQPTTPLDLAELLSDGRNGRPLHHLRRLYPDPFTGAADWVLLRDERGGITGLHSRSTLPALRRQGLPPGVAGGDGPQQVGDWRFIASAEPAPPAVPTPAAAAPPAPPAPPFPETEAPSDGPANTLSPEPRRPRTRSRTP